MRLILNYKCKQCSMLVGMENMLVNDTVVDILDLSLKEIKLKIDGRKYVYSKFRLHECNNGFGICEFVGLTGKKD